MGEKKADFYLLLKALLLFPESSSAEESQMAGAWGSEWMKVAFTHTTVKFKAKLMGQPQGLL